MVSATVPAQAASGKHGKTRASHQRVLAIARMKGLKPNEKIVGMVLAARDETDLYPGVDTLAKDAGLSIRAVKYALAGLRQVRVLSSKRRGWGRSNRYWIDYGADPLLVQKTCPNGPGRKPAPRLGQKTCPSNGAENLPHIKKREPKEEREGSVAPPRGVRPPPPEESARTSEGGSPAPPAGQAGDAAGAEPWRRAFLEN